jgi:hypothetical protein
MIRVSTPTRDLVREGARRHGETQGEYVDRAVRELAHQEWVREAFDGSVKAMQDPTYVAEMRAWENADLGTNAHLPVEEDDEW